jgi:polyisoprenoid-binding protein YceI
MFRSLSASLLFAAAVAQAEPLTFDFKDPKGVNNAVFKLDAPLEAISGSASGISGKVVFDPGNPGVTRGKIVVASGSLQVPNPMMQQHMLGDKWLDVAKHSEITFEVREFKNVKTVQGVTSGEVQGAFTLRGITKEMTVPVKLTYLKDKLSQRVPNQKGDLLVIRANFEIKRSDFNINPGQNEDKVADVIEVTLSIAGAAAR